MPRLRGYSHLLLDIEGTTCPVSFVAETLFPYASEHLAGFLESERRDPAVAALLEDVVAAWHSDPDPEAIALRDGGNPEQLDPVAYLKLLIAQDRKLSALKDLQGRIWEAGYAKGELVAPLYTDVPAALHRWLKAGVQLAVYSSGSVAAQQLLYGHSNAGDLRGVFGHWFDTRTGPKQISASYLQIAEQMKAAPGDVLFISDSLAECEAARQSGMAVLFSDRAGNPQRDAGGLERIHTYTDLVIEP